MRTKKTKIKITLPAIRVKVLSRIYLRIYRHISLFPWCAFANKIKLSEWNIKSSKNRVCSKNISIFCPSNYVKVAVPITPIPLSPIILFRAKSGKRCVMSWSGPCITVYTCSCCTVYNSANPAWDPALWLDNEYVTRSGSNEKVQFSTPNGHEN